MTGAALFDLDGTLLALNTGAAWQAHEWRTGAVRPRDVARRAARLAAYALGALDLDALARRAVADLAGRPEADVRAAQEAWYAARVRPTLRPGAAALVEGHRRQGHALALVTGASPYVAVAAARDLGIPAVVSTRLEVAAGRFTGRVLGPVCLGEGKLAAARAWAAEAGVDLAASWYYTDGAEDLPVLAAVGHPVAVHPDPRLRREARRRGYPIRELHGA